jgi:hypothetical protein
MNSLTTQTLQYGNVTIIVHQPVLTEKERAKREQQVQDAMCGVMREYYKREESQYGRA